MLVEPITAGNIGSAARAMTNMGLHDLRLVNPIADLHDQEAKKFGHGAQELLDQTKIYSTLQEAVCDCSLTIATSHKPTRYHQESYLIGDLGKKLAPYCQNNKVAILFGRENHGLSNDEINCCAWLVHIPTAVPYPSLNLAQAVMIVCYELFLASMPEASPIMPKLASTLEIEKFLQYTQELLDLVGFQHKNERPDLFIGILRRMFMRIGLESRDIPVFYKMFHQFYTLAKTQQKKF